jgi:hypothetical protein
MRILITGGPVHAYLDAVKIITNKFKGGLMAELGKESRLREFLRGIGSIREYICLTLSVEFPTADHAF